MSLTATLGGAVGPQGGGITPPGPESPGPWGTPTGLAKCTKWGALCQASDEGPSHTL